MELGETLISATHSSAQWTRQFERQIKMFVLFDKAMILSHAITRRYSLAYAISIYRLLP